MTTSHELLMHTLIHNRTCTRTICVCVVALSHLNYSYLLSLDVHDYISLSTTHSHLHSAPTLAHTRTLTLGYLLVA